MTINVAKSALWLKESGRLKQNHVENGTDLRKKSVLQWFRGLIIHCMPFETSIPLS